MGSCGFGQEGGDIELTYMCGMHGCLVGRITLTPFDVDLMLMMGIAVRI